MTFLDPMDDQTGPDARATHIQLAIFDVDGVMTDGRLYLSDSGEQFKTMHVHDGLGLKRLTEAGVEVGVISGQPSKIVQKRLQSLGITEIHLDCDDKMARLQQLLDARQLADHHLAVMGDDLPDLPLMQQAGLALSVANALPEVRRASHWVSGLAGGNGAVRQACELIIAARADA